MTKMPTMLLAAVWLGSMLTAVPAFALSITAFADLTGGSIFPIPSGSSGTGAAVVVLDTAAHTLSVDVTFSGLTSLASSSHIHCCAAVGNTILATQAPTFPGFPAGVTSGIYSQIFDTTLSATFAPGFVTAHGGTAAGAEAALAAGILAREAYLDIHTTQFPGGEIRGQLEPAPEPSTWLLLATGLGGLLCRGRWRRRTA